MTNTEQRLRDAGIGPDDVETQIFGQDKALVITGRELIFVDGLQIQRGRLRDITNVKTARTGELSVRSASEGMIEGNILGFDRTELKFFFESVKNAIARAKVSATNGSLPISFAERPQTHGDQTLGDGPAITSTAEDWRMLTGTASADPDAFRLPIAAAEPAVPPLAEPQLEPRPESHLESHAEAQLESHQGHAETESSHIPDVFNQPLEHISAPPALESQQADDADPWAATKQTFEVEPEQPAAPPPTVQPENDWVPPSSEWSRDAQRPDAPADTMGTGIVMPQSNDWDGETLDANKALGVARASDLERPVMQLGTDNAATLLALARWLKIIAVIFFLSGTAFTATLFPQDTSNVLAYLLVLAAFLGSVLFALMAWSLSELIVHYASSVQDLRSIRRATLGH